MSDQLIRYGTQAKPFYIAVCKYGYGVDRVVAMAIRLAQTEVPADSKRAPLLVYRSEEYIEPTGFGKTGAQWPNGTKPGLCGLTNTHAGFQQKQRL